MYILSIKSVEPMLVAPDKQIGDLALIGIKQPKVVTKCAPVLHEKKLGAVVS